MLEFHILDPTDSVDKVVAKLEDSAELAINTLFPMEEIVTDMFRVEETIFSSGGRRGGGSWKKLKDDTVKRKGSVDILRGTGNSKYGDGPGDKLFESLTVRGAEFQILDVSRTGIIFGTERPFAAVHQQGSSSRNIPRRPFIKFTPFDIGRWNKILLNHIVKPFK